jgi:hypothetical protein
VRFLVPDSPLLEFSEQNYARRIFRAGCRSADFYFWGTFDPRYQALLGLKDFGEAEVTGALVAARDGKGLYIYTGLVVFPRTAGGPLPGAYRLFVNLLSQTPHAAGKD